MSRRVFITVAEVSGDKHAAQLIRGLKKLDPQLIIEGHGGPEMAAAGAKIHRETVTRAAMGWRGALRAAEIYPILRWTRNYFDEYKPDIQIGVDSPSMNIHFAKAAHMRGIPALQYVAPQLWAWAPWRMRKYRRWVDQVACILPFEESYFRAHGVNATFVGHPLFDELPLNRQSEQRAGRNGRPPIVGLLPGSRKSEADRNFPAMLQVAQRLRNNFPGIQFLVPTTAATHPIVEKRLKKVKGPGLDSLSPQSSVLSPAVSFEQDAFDNMVPRCDLCVTVSGTATLHVAAFGVPMIVVYRVNPISWNIAGRWLVQTRTFALVNVLAEQTPAIAAAAAGGHIVPEFVPWNGPIEPVANLAIDMLRQPERLEAQRRELGQMIRSLDAPGASMNVAKLAIQMIEGRSAVKMAG